MRRQPSTPELQARDAEKVGKYWGLVADPSIVVMMNGPMYHSAPAAYGMSSARLRLSIVLQPRFDAEDMLRMIDSTVSATCTSCPQCSCDCCACPPR